LALKRLPKKGPYLTRKNFYPGLIYGAGFLKALNREDCGSGYQKNFTKTNGILRLKIIPGENCLKPSEGIQTKLFNSTFGTDCGPETRGFLGSQKFHIQTRYLGEAFLILSFNCVLTPPGGNSCLANIPP